MRKKNTGTAWVCVSVWNSPVSEALLVTESDPLTCEKINRHRIRKESAEDCMWANMIWGRLRSDTQPECKNVDNLLLFQQSGTILFTFQFTMLLPSKNKSHSTFLAFRNVINIINMRNSSTGVRHSPNYFILLVSLSLFWARLVIKTSILRSLK